MGGCENKVEGGKWRSCLVKIKFCCWHSQFDNVKCLIVTEWHWITMGRRDMGWLRLVGTLKLQVSFAEYSLCYRSLLQKRPTILRSILIVATPYVILTWYRSKNTHFSESGIFSASPENSKKHVLRVDGKSQKKIPLTLASFLMGSKQSV